MNKGKQNKDNNNSNSYKVPKNKKEVRRKPPVRLNKQLCTNYVQNQITYLYTFL